MRMMIDNGSYWSRVAQYDHLVMFGSIYPASQTNSDHGGKFYIDVTNQLLAQNAS